MDIIRRSYMLITPGSNKGLKLSIERIGVKKRLQMMNLKTLGLSFRDSILIYFDI